MSVKFVDELPGSDRGPNSTKWSKIADELRANPGQWAVVAEDVHPSLAQYLRSGRGTGKWVPQDFEVATRQIKGTTKANVFARYVGSDA